jgi:hypothetical protein
MRALSTLARRSAALKQQPRFLANQAGDEAWRQPAPIPDYDGWYTRDNAPRPPCPRSPVVGWI